MKLVALTAAAVAVLTASVLTGTVHAETKPAAQTKPAPVMVKVVEGDTLSSIAEKHETTWVRIFNANESVENPDLINPGEELRIPAADEELADRALPQAAPAPTETQAVSYSGPAQTTTYRTASTTAAASYPVDSNAAKAYIYSKESGNNPNATNPSGCYGIGQDCNGVVRSQCGADYACQDQYFTNYMASRYGSWENALAFWQANHWW